MVRHISVKLVDQSKLTNLVQSPLIGEDGDMPIVGGATCSFPRQLLSSMRMSGRGWRLYLTWLMRFVCVC